MAEYEKRGILLEVIPGGKLKIQPSGPLGENLANALIENKDSIVRELKTPSIGCGDCEYLKDFQGNPDHIGPYSFRWRDQFRAGGYPMQRICDGFVLKTGSIVH